MNFLIQTFEDKVKHDFSFHLIESCEYHNWYNRNKNFTCTFMNGDNFEMISDGFIPIGSVDFVTSYLKHNYKLTPKPINIPNELLSIEFTNRKVINGTNIDIIGKSFVKSNEKIKSFTEICDEAPAFGEYQISEIIDIVSEWRAFVYKGKLVGLQNYTGEFDIFPNVSIINNMIREYKSAPIAYTLDVAIQKNSNKTVIIEVHDFFSCGLYGFADYKILPYMFSDWFNEFIKKQFV